MTNKALERFISEGCAQSLGIPLLNGFIAISYKTDARTACITMHESKAGVINQEFSYVILRLAKR